MRSSNIRHGEEKGVTCMFWLKGLRMLEKKVININLKIETNRSIFIPSRVMVLLSSM